MAMLRPALLYGFFGALFALLLAWMDYRHIAREWSTELYVLLIALLFAALGIWLGQVLAPRAAPSEFARNDQAIAYLGISVRECEVLDLLAEGCPNKVIARRLDISPNTVKTHVASLFDKLEVANRTQAIGRARELRLLP